ncbi:MAG: hypothetical protein JJU33_06660 [Phycisphaerales bacterium]|nr:hypothetical protein [Phycisphaerales bacterium]
MRNAEAELRRHALQIIDWTIGQSPGQTMLLCIATIVAAGMVLLCCGAGMSLAPERRIQTAMKILGTAVLLATAIAAIYLLSTYMVFYREDRRALSRGHRLSQVAVFFMPAAMLTAGALLAIRQAAEKILAPATARRIHRSKR